MRWGIAVLSILVIFAAAIYSALVVGSSIAEKDQTANQLKPVVSPTPVPTQVPLAFYQKPSSTLTPTPSNAGIVISEPRPDQNITSPVLIRGQAKMPHHSVSFVIREQNGRVLNQYTLALPDTSVDHLNSFYAQLPYAKPKGMQGVIEIYQNPSGPNGGSVSIPVKFAD